ncbi:hypothetical protein [Flavobacterium sp. HSC-61S13]|uniref:hypothetical protein n=1 Tax=Flavobacterium sp. HSC-61S13 TaxID=2910963 RepID=UPI00209CF164|nr:hypothetical protein [Flavobacterium sp. HSC-61S13]MCP1997276.1 hypothetical protein [Flavobacterium sp. HSC-61S13]
MEYKFLIKDVLALDCLYNFLSIYERHLCHLILLEKSLVMTERIQKVVILIETLQWKSPIWRYDHDRVLYYETETGQQPIRYYENEIGKIINQQIKNK